MRLGLLAALALLLAACGGHAARTPEQVARAWSAALDRNDNRGAAALFSSGAEVVQDTPLVLQGKNDAVRWNQLLPCGGVIQSVEPQGDDEVLVLFTLTERPGHTCDGPGDNAAAVFKVVHGKIVLWHQVPPPTASV